MQSLLIQQNIRSFIKVIICGAISLLCWGHALAQSQDNTPKRGFQPAGSYALTDLEDINTVNGNMIYRVPMASLPNGRGDSPGAKVGLFYNSKLYDAKTAFRYNSESQLVGTSILNKSDEGGWRYGFEYKLEVEERSEQYAYGGMPQCPSSQAFQVYKLKMSFPDGSVREFRPRNPSGGVFNDLSNDNFFEIRPDGYILTCSPQNPHYWAYDPITYYSADGSYLRLVVEHDDESGDWADNPWTLFFPDGGRVTFNEPGSLGQRFYDRNNNFTEVRSITYNGHPAHQIIDDLDRSIIIEYDAPAVKDYIRVKGVGSEELQWTVWWATTYVVKSYYSYLSDPMFLEELVKDHIVVQRIDLPSQAGTLAYTFGYNGSPTYIYPTHSYGYGELSSVTLPTTAQATYQYYHDNADSLSAEFVLWNQPTGKTLTYQREYDGGSTGATEVWQYTSAEIGSCGAISCGKVTGPDGGVSTDYITNTGSWDKKLVYKTERPDGTVVERIWQQNVPVGMSGAFSVSVNPFIKTEFTSVRNASGTLVKTAIKDFKYDKNGNQTQVTEYDWVPYVDVPRSGGVFNKPTGIPGSATIKRATVNTYYNPTPDASDTTTDDPDVYHKPTSPPSSPRLRNAIESSETRSGTSPSSALARTEYFYDNFSTTGNLTTEKRWDSTKGAISRPLVSAASECPPPPDPCVINAINVAHQYDSYGNRHHTTDANNVTTWFVYGLVNGHSNLYVTETKVADSTPVQRWTMHAYDFYTGLVTQSTDMDNNVVTKTTYDVFGRPTLVQEAYNITSVEKQTATEYSDTQRRVIVRSDLNTTGDGKLITIQHYDQLGRVRLTRRLESGNPAEATDETKGVKIQARYFAGDASNNNYGLVSAPYRAATSGAASGEPGMAWKRTKFDKGGRVLEAETFVGAALPAPWGSNLASSGKVTTEYDAEFATVTDQALKKRRSRADGLGRLVRVDEPDSGGDLGATTTPKQPTDYTYNALDNLIQTNQTGKPNGGSSDVTQVRTFTFGSLGRLISANNPESGLISYEYDPNGNLTKKTDARGIVINYTYDQLNRNKTVDYLNIGVNPDITREYDNPASGEYGKGRLWRSYAGGNESVGQNVEKQEITGYDALGRVKSVRQSFKTNGVWSGLYSISQTYDLAGHVKTKTHPSGRSVTYTYDVAGDLTSFTGNLGNGGAPRTYSTGIQYNPQGQLIREQFVMDAPNAPLYHRRHYNSRGQLFDVRLGTDSNPANDGPDPGQWTGASWNRGALRSYFSSSLNEYAWPAQAPQNDNGDLYRQDHFVPTGVDGAGNVTTWGLSADYYSYDSLNRVTRVQEESYYNGGGYVPNIFDQQFSYDRFGNRLISLATGTGAPNPGFKIKGEKNRLIAPPDNDGSQPSDLMQYDAAGNLIKDTHTQMGTSGNRTYDAENRMLTADGANGLANSYAYDADGHRTRRSINNGGEVWWQIYGIGGELVAEYQLVSGTPTLKKEYGYRNGQLLVIAETTGTCQWLVTDALGTPRMIADQTGSLAGMKRRDYLPFGEELLAGIGHRQQSNGYSAAQSQQPRQQFTGKERDSETGMDYFMARYYGSLYGRFTSPDEFTGGPDELYDFADAAADNPTFYADLTDPQSLNKYQYCYNNPLTTVDPDGHKGWRERLSEAASAVAVAAADFGDGVIRGAAASLSYGTAPGSGPSSNDSLINRAGQVLGTAIVGGVGTESIAAGGAAIVGTGGAAALTVAPVVAVAGGAVMVGGAAKNAVALATTPIKSVTNNQQSNGGSNGGASSSGGGSNASNKKPVVIGENMQGRVKPYAKANGADNYKPRNWSMSNNKRWIRDMKKQGREIHDIGIDPTRRRRSKPYEMESNEVKDYPLLKKVN